MMFLSPMWLLLAFPLGISLWLLRSPSRLIQILRMLMFVMILLALAGFAIRMPSRTGTVVIVADRSSSMPFDAAARQKEAIDLAISEMSEQNNLAIVTFAERAMLERPPQKGDFNGFLLDTGNDASNLSEALELAISVVPKNRSGRILVLSDGRWTGKSPEISVPNAITRNIPIDYRLIERPTTDDLAVMNIDTPRQVAPGQSYMINVWVKSPRKQDVEYELKRNSRTIGKGKTNLSTGVNKLTFRDKATSGGTVKYQFLVSGQINDPVPENNTAKMLLGIKGQKPMLCVSNDAGFADLLQSSGVNVVGKEPQQCSWDIDDLSSYSAVLLEDVPADQIGKQGMENIAAWVRETGSGLMMTGGKNSYGPGGYFKSPLEPVMPVSMELRREHRKLSVAIVIALDRSGSMAARVAGGKTKMDLANIASAQVLDMLSPMDEIGVVAVDSAAHTVVDLASAEKNRLYRNMILGIESMGGGIFVYEALSHAADMLADATPQTRHIILFADAADSEQAGKYKELLEQCTNAGITVSVVGLGSSGDVDAKLLEDIARRGNGRCFFTVNPEELPRLFAQDTFVVARSTFLDEPVSVRSTPALIGLAGRNYDFTKQIGGYNLCYVRPEADLVAVSEDEYKAPIVAAWQVGAGRALCYTAQVNGKHTGQMAGWKDLGSFYSSLAKWGAGEASELGPDMLLTQQLSRGNCVIKLHLDPERSDNLADLPKVSTLFGKAGQKPSAMQNTMQYEDADTLTIELPVSGENSYLSTVKLPGMETPVTMPPACLPYSPEFMPDNNDRGEMTLQNLAKATSGVERVDLAGVWQDIPKRSQYLPLGSWLIVFAVILLLVEVLERRTSMVSSLGDKLLKLDITGIKELAPVRDSRQLNARKKQRQDKMIGKRTFVTSQHEESKQVIKNEAEAKQESDILNAFSKAQKVAKNRTRKNKK